MDKNGQVIILSPEREKELACKLNLKGLWKELENGQKKMLMQKNVLIYSFVPFGKEFLVGKSIWDTIINSKDKEKKVEEFRKNSPFQVYHPYDYPKRFVFPNNYPVEGVVYVRSVADENKFYPFSSYFEYLKKEKMNDFQKLCASLGAKKISVVYDDSDDKSYTQTIGGQYQAVNAELSGKFESNKSNGRKICVEFPETNNKIQEYDSFWAKYEPTWEALKDIRTKSGVLKYQAEFNFTDDFGINVKLAATYQNFELNIGGEFQAIKKSKEIYEVEFWPLSE